MKIFSRYIFFAGVAVVAGACSDSTTTPATSALARAALVSAPISFDQINTSFVGSSDANAGFVPGFAQGDGQWGRHDDDHDGGPGWKKLMGGGIADAFRGTILFGRGFGRGPFGDLGGNSNCAFSSTDNRVTCGALSRRGLTVNRSFKFLDASGAVQQAFDTASTNSVNVVTTVAGTRIHHDGNDTSTVDSKSDLTVAGLASGATQRTVDGTTAGSETTKGLTHDNVAFTSVRTAGDTATEVVIPLQNGRPTYPTAGTIIRSMQATVTLAGQSPTQSTRREVITFDGTNTAQISVTQDGVTKTGTLSLVGEGLNCHD